MTAFQPVKPADSGPVFLTATEAALWIIQQRAPKEWENRPVEATLQQIQDWLTQGRILPC